MAKEFYKPGDKQVQNLGEPAKAAPAVTQTPVVPPAAPVASAPAAEPVTTTATPVAPVAPPAPKVLSEFTRCWLVSHPVYGAARVKEDTEEEAIATFCAHRCPGVTPERIRDRIEIHEQKFTPAETEIGKPGGFKRDKKKVSMARI